MRYYPVNLDIQGKECIVVGCGEVGSRKVCMLLTCGARVTVIAPDISEKIVNMAKEHLLSLKPLKYQPSDINGVFLVIAATNDEAINHKISCDAKERGVLCNVVDRPKDSTFVLPSIISKGDLVIAISTSGKSPAFSKWLRERLSDELGVEYARFLELMGALRGRVFTHNNVSKGYKEIFEELIEKGIFNLIKEEKWGEVNTVLSRVVGHDYTVESLLMEIKND
ncbi:MAG: bifunctional precorrin-2 dehydrogenase/sirohydrochlorin ferrochelatase [Pseudomonadota bacterium]